MAKKSKYTDAQKRAYYSGQGYRAGYEGKEIPFKSEKNKQSFKEGFASVKVTVFGYPPLKSASKKEKPRAFSSSRFS